MEQPSHPLVWNFQRGSNTIWVGCGLVLLGPGCGLVLLGPGWGLVLLGPGWGLMLLGPGWGLVLLGPGWGLVLLGPGWGLVLLGPGWGLVLLGPGWGHLLLLPTGESYKSITTLSLGPHLLAEHDILSHFSSVFPSFVDVYSFLLPLLPFLMDPCE